MYSKESMTLWVVLIIVVQVVLILGIFYFSSDLRRFDKIVHSELESNHPKLEHFSAPVEFNAFPETIIVENPFVCTTNELKKCSMSDPTSCFGCQNLLARCVHFEQDTKWIPAESSSNQDEIIIPANESPDEGYCLQTVSLVETCNLFHGDFVLVQTSPESQESQLICLCKNPGVIGNTSILGNCSTVLGCNGAVKDLNVPFKDLECNCPSGMFPARNNDIPVCHYHTVDTYPNPDDLTFERETISSSLFHNNISGNVRSKRLVNPCLYDLFDGSPVNGMLVTVGETHFCVALDSDHVAVRRNPNGARLLKGDVGPDAVIKLSYEHMNYYGELEKQMLPNLVAVFTTTKNPRLEKYGLSPNRTYAIDLTGHQDEIMRYFAPRTTINQVPQGICEGNFPTYHCQYVNTSPFVGGMIESDPDLQIRFRWYAGRNPPPFFFSNTGDWVNIEQRLNPFVNMYPQQIAGTNLVRQKFHMNPNYFSNSAQVERLRPLALRFVVLPDALGFRQMRIELWRTNNFNDFNATRQRYIPFPSTNTLRFQPVTTPWATVEEVQDEETEGGAL